MNIFISYSSIDRTFARKLRRDLESLGYSIWMDEKNIHVGASFTREIQEGLDSADFLILVVSPDALKSGWVELEWSSALIRQITEKGKKILPVIYHKAELPIFLKNLLYADASSNYPLALAKLVMSMQNEKPAPFQFFIEDDPLEKHYSFSKLISQPNQELVFCGFTLAGSVFDFADNQIADWIRISKKFEVFIARPEHTDAIGLQPKIEFYKRKFSYYQLDAVLQHCQNIYALLNAQNQAKFKVYLLDLPRINLLNIKRVGGFWFCRLIGFNQTTKSSPVIVTSTSSQSSKFFENYINNLRNNEEFRTLFFSKSK